MSHHSKSKARWRAEHFDTPEKRIAVAIHNFRRARLDYTNDLDADYDHNRDDMNRNALVRRWRQLVERLQYEGKPLDMSVLGTDPRVRQALGIEVAS